MAQIEVRVRVSEELARDTSDSTLARLLGDLAVAAVRERLDSPEKDPPR